MTNDELKTGKEICGRATPGRWQHISLGVIVDNDGCMISAVNLEKEEKNADFIAHFNPERVAKLLEEVERLQKESRELHKGCTDRELYVEVINQRNLFHAEIKRLKYEIHSLTHQGRQGGLEQANVGLAEERNSLKAEVERQSALISDLQINNDGMHANFTKMEQERDRLASDALGILSANGIPTPEKGYVIEPHMLALDIKTLARERDAALARVENSKEIKSMAKQVVSHWNEFGPEHGLDAVMHYLERAIAEDEKESGE